MSFIYGILFFFIVVVLLLLILMVNQNKQKRIHSQMVHESNIYD